jgi:hypothetical protein
VSNWVAEGLHLLQAQARNSDLQVGFTQILVLKILFGVNFT